MTLPRLHSSTKTASAASDFMAAAASVLGGDGTWVRHQRVGAGREDLQRAVTSVASRADSS